LVDVPKIALLGLARAGKTSIYKKCFERQTIEELQQILPTIMVTQNQVNLEHVSKRISIWDFGGQETFRQAYLQKPDYFAYTKIVIFIVDMLEIDELETAKKYFAEILDVLDKKNRPKIYVFIHKCDPDKIEQYKERIYKIIAEITGLFGESVEFLLTSIYDDSACKAINRILFLTLPEEVIDQIFSGLFIEDMKKAIFKKLGESITKEHIAEISEISEVFGDLLTEKLYDLWVKSTLKSVDSKIESKITSLIQPIVKDGMEKYKLKCDIDTESEIEGELMKGIVKGILKALDFTERTVELIIEGDECFIIF